MKKLFTERHGGAKARVAEVLDQITRDALLALVRARVDEEWFGLAFPAKCGDGYAFAGTDLSKLEDTLKGYSVLTPQQASEPADVPTDGQVFDLIEFSYEHVAQALNPTFHRYMSHSHYEYDQAAGRAAFEHDVNRLLERNGLAFALVEGEVIRLAPSIIAESLAQTLFHTGDGELDRLLETARRKFLDRSPEVRRESLEALWDAWERRKTVEPAADKKASVTALLDKVTSEKTMRALIEQEARQLSEIGNSFMIRHSETNKVPVTESVQIDYLFHRMFAAIRFILKATGRGG